LNSYNSFISNKTNRQKKKDKKIMKKIITSGFSRSYRLRASFQHFATVTSSPIDAVTGATIGAIIGGIIG